MTTPEIPGPPKADWWNVWLFRIANVVGLILIVREAVLPRQDGAEPSWPILLVGLALISGSIGIQFLLKGGGR